MFGTSLSFMCGSQTPFRGDDGILYGFASAAASVPCCSCWQLDITGDTAAAGRSMVVQVVDNKSPSELAEGKFLLAMPGAGKDFFQNSCSNQFFRSSDHYNGALSNRGACAALPAYLQEGCRFRYEYLLGAASPYVTYKRVICPRALLSRSGCEAKQDTKFDDHTAKPVPAFKSTAVVLGGAPRVD